MEITFEPADARRDHAVLTELNIEYLDWLDANIQHDFGIGLPTLLGQSIPDYVAATLAKLCDTEPPEGVFYTVRRDGRVVGMGGVRGTSDGASEMKRVFVRPDQRGGGLGAIIVRRLIADAETYGYASMRLDSGPFMTSAHRLYEAEGFQYRPIYDGAEVPSELHHNWRFMERSLRGRMRENGDPLTGSIGNDDVAFELLAVAVGRSHRERELGVGEDGEEANRSSGRSVRPVTADLEDEELLLGPDDLNL